VKLTDAGEAYLHVVRESLDRLRDGTRDMFSRRSAQRLVTVRCNVGFANHWLAPRLARF
jgi:LysR family glycine cleavage system transcriptional activator